MKVAPLYHELISRAEHDVKLIHTGQHYDPLMSGVFLDQLKLPKPHYYLDIGSGSHAYQTGQTMIEYEKLCLKDGKPDLVIVVGDVNATIACTLAAKKIGINVAHLEAGLRSFDRAMPEEINRILTDSIADILWTPSFDGNEHLLKENVPEDKITLVGNIMIDSLCMMMNEIDKSDILSIHDLQPKEYAVITLHRPANVDNVKELSKILEAIRQIESKLIMPVHPRTLKTLSHAIKEHNITNLILIDPLPYNDFIKLVKNAEFVLTDSGGIQEETTYLNVPCFTIRDNTERPITITEGTNILVNANNLHEYTQERKVGTVPALWDGQTASRIADDIDKRFG